MKHEPGTLRLGIVEGGIDPATLDYVANLFGAYATHGDSQDYLNVCTLLTQVAIMGVKLPLGPTLTLFRHTPENLGEFEIPLTPDILEARLDVKLRIVAGYTCLDFPVTLGVLAC